MKFDEDGGGRKEQKCESGLLADPCVPVRIAVQNKPSTLLITNLLVA
jgi:hypothetical protein